MMPNEKLKGVNWKSVTVNGEPEFTSPNFITQTLRTRGKTLGIPNHGYVDSPKRLGLLVRGGRPDRDAPIYKSPFQTRGTIINLEDDIEAVEHERDVCLLRGTKFISLLLPDKRAFTDVEIASMIEVVRKIRDAELLDPIFVHCKGGRHRTGVFIALVRLLIDGWCKPMAWDEMIRFGYYDGRGHRPLGDFVRNLDVAKARAEFRESEERR